MPLYFFHICDGDGMTEDEEGRELAGVDAARAEAIRGARSLMAGDVQNGLLNLGSFIDVEDAEGKPLFTLHFSEAVQFQT